jgi:hypothetical protein
MKLTQASDETNLTEIEILPDGRILLFGASREVLEVLDAVQSGRDPAVQSRLVQSGQSRLVQSGQSRLVQSGQTRNSHKPKT